MVFLCSLVEVEYTTTSCISRYRIVEFSCRLRLFCILYIKNGGSSFRKKWLRITNMACVGPYHFLIFQRLRFSNWLFSVSIHDYKSCILHTKYHLFNSIFILFKKDYVSYLKILWYIANKLFEEVAGFLADVILSYFCEISWYYSLNFVIFW